MSPNADDVQLTTSACLTVNEADRQWTGHSKKSLSSGDLDIGHG
jgi:hypothetical protein